MARNRIIRQQAAAQRVELKLSAGYVLLGFTIIFALLSMASWTFIHFWLFAR